MSISVPVLYGRKSLMFEIPEGVKLNVLSSGEVKKAADNAVREALKNPIASEPLEKLAAGAKDILIITSDNTRPMPSKKTLPEIIKAINREDCNIKILIATGLHRAMTKEEIGERFGELAGSYEIINHDGANKSALVDLGELSTGNRLIINKLVPESDLVIGEGFIEPHFFAGFSGGRKCVMPGVCAEETVMNNHRTANIAHAHSVSGELLKNIISLECEEAAKKAGLAFILNVALNAKKEITAAFAGDPIKAHHAGCEYVREKMSVKAPPADIVITSNSGYPLDRNIYQAVKGLSAAAEAAKEGGVIILCCECSDGKRGNENFERIISAASSREEFLDLMRKEASELDRWQAEIFARVLLKCKVILLSGCYDKSSAGRLFMEHAATPEEALEMAFRIKGKGASINILPEGPTIIPVAI